ncbi:MAG: ATP-dependent RNA helicase HrpA [Gammaproteobacteria bacterium]|nr:ATP-dependent RNA helicase HrpA [Gammaproteobacteria bacterium]
MTKNFKQQILQQCAIADRGQLFKLLRQTRSKKTAEQARQRLIAAIEQSKSQVGRRRKNRPIVSLNRDLPFFNKRDELKQVIRQNQVVIVCGETGSGKTTQLPQICMDLGLADRGKIGHTQPRRLAARSVTARIAEELNTRPGEVVGYKVRFTDTTRPDSYVKLMTDGILLAEIQNDRWLNEYQTLIIDEAHERSLNIDLLLGYIKTLLPRRPDLKLVITSATIDPERFSSYFDDAPIVMVSGRTYPVELRYRPVVDEDQKDRDRIQAVIDALDELFTISPQDTLVFFAGERQIREATDKIRKRFHQYEVLPLYARLSNEQQQRIFRQGRQRKIILSTNVAETSLTVPGINYVIDTGLARVSRYSWRAKVQRLPIEKISRASANQRSGRCGRTAEGICIRLYDQEDFDNRPEFTEPEILRTNLASVILQMDSLRVGHIRDFDFIEPPDSRLISDGYRLLHELQAVWSDDTVTRLGKTISRFPIDPRLARMLIQASEFGCLNEMLVIVAVLSIQDPRDLSQDHRQAANEKFKRWQDTKSDFAGWLNLWAEINTQKQALSRNQFAKWCKKQYLSWFRVREWQDIHQQIREQAKELKLYFNSREADIDLVHRAILSGIPSHVAYHDQESQYKTTRNRDMMIFPGSALAKKTPKWIMAFSLIDTARLYAHVVAVMNPQWAMRDLLHLHQYEYYEPHWQEKQGRVGAYRNTRLYGLLIEGGKKVNFASIDQKAAREIFIREALVEGRYRTTVAFIKANRKLIEFYRTQEERERRRDLLIGDEQIYDFYDGRLPDAIVDVVTFESWVKKLDADSIKQLTLIADDVLATDHEKDNQSYPEALTIKDQTLRLKYVFDPGDEADGVSVLIPLALLNQFDDSDFDFLVPGLLKEKVQALIKSLPKQLRKNFIPVPDFARACTDALNPDQPLYSQLSKRLQRMTGIEVALDQWRPDKIDKHFLMRYCLEEDGVAVASSRSLQQLKAQYAGLANARFEQQVQHDESISRQGITTWDFGRLPEQVSLRKSKASGITAFPALVDYQDAVAIELFETRQDAQFYHASGIARLIAIELKKTIKYLQKNLPDIDQSALMYVAMGSKQELVEDIIMAAIFDCFLSGRLPEQASEFDAVIQQNKSQFIATVNQMAQLVHKILKQYREVRTRLQHSNLSADHLNDCREQCGHLVYQGFVRDIAPQQLSRLPVYLQAMVKRIDKTELDSRQADRVLPLIRDLWQEYLALENHGDATEQLDALHWMIEEFRINCFAQPMKTRGPVSEKKIRKLIDAIRSGGLSVVPA